jgi:hypothetical protein
MGGGWLGALWLGAYAMGGSAPDDAAATETRHQGKYRAEWAGALEDVQNLPSFRDDHAGVVLDVGDAGI